MEDYLKRYYERNREFYHEMDKGIGNESIIGYALVAAKWLGLKEEEIRKLDHKIRQALDTYNAEQAARLSIEGLDVFKREREN